VLTSINYPARLLPPASHPLSLFRRPHSNSPEPVVVSVGAAKFLKIHFARFPILGSGRQVWLPPQVVPRCSPTFLGLTKTGLGLAWVFRRFYLFSDERDYLLLKRLPNCAFIMPLFS
jgi:hypothetical protein